jgi:hypothetical protein
MRNLVMFLAAAAASPAMAQRADPAEEKEIVITGVADGARVVEVDFDKVWKNCAECKRALAKLDKLARGYRDELEVAGQFASGTTTSHCRHATPSNIASFQRSSAEPVGGQPRTPQQLVDGLCAARMADSSRRTREAMIERHVVPEQAQMLAYMRSFIDQIAPHLKEATEAERVIHKASVGLTDAKRTKLGAKDLKRIDVTTAVIARLDAKDFTIVLPDPPPPGPASGGYKGQLKRSKN